MAGVTFYLNGGRYVTTDDAYVGAQKVLITPDISGKIISVAVKEGQLVSLELKRKNLGKQLEDFAQHGFWGYALCESSGAVTVKPLTRRERA